MWMLQYMSLIIYIIIECMAVAVEKFNIRVGK